MNEEKTEKAAENRAFSKFYRDIYGFLRDEKECLLVYTIIMNEATWGECKKTKRRVHELKPGQFLTSFRDLQKRTGMHYADLQNVMNILADMGLISTEVFPKVGICITILNACVKNVQSATESLKSDGIWRESNTKRSTPKSTSDSPASHVKGQRVTRQRVTDSARVTRWRVTDGQRVTRQRVTEPLPSLLEKEEANENKIHERKNLPAVGRSPDFDLFDPIPEQTPPDSITEIAQNGAKFWCEMIKQKFPKSLVQEKELIPIVEQCLEQMRGIPEISHKDFTDIIGIAGEMGTPFQNVMLFKAPKAILKRDANNTSIFEELCEVMRHSVQKHFAKDKRKYRRARY